MMDMYVTSGMVQSSLTKFYTNHGKKKHFKDVVAELYKKENYVTTKPSLPKDLSLSNLADDKFLNFLIYCIV